jgi:hypothetical protein
MQKECASLLQVLLKFIMGREEPGDFHPIINEWGGGWVVPSPVRGSLSQSMVNLRCSIYF